MISDRLKKQIEFMLEIDKLKNIYRQTYVLAEDRKENDAEHSWHIALLAFMLVEYSNEPIDVTRVVKMLLIHDIVEIDAGDTYRYDEESYKSKAQREEKAAQRIFGILPDDMYNEYYSLWREFEDKSSFEAGFAAVLDRLQPILLNFTKNGISWKEHGIYKKQVLEAVKDFGAYSSELARLISSVLDEAADKGFLKI